MTVQSTPEVRERVARNLIEAGYIEERSKKRGVAVVEAAHPAPSAALGR